MKFEVRKAILNQTFSWQLKKKKKTNCTYKWTAEKFQGENPIKSYRKKKKNYRKTKENKKIPTNESVLEDLHDHNLDENHTYCYF